MEIHDLSPTRFALERLYRRFPADQRREPETGDMRRLRKLLSATGGDVSELMRWAEAVRDTDDEDAALAAYRARQEWAALMAIDRRNSAARRLAEAQFLDRLRRMLADQAKRKGPRGDRYGVRDFWIVYMAEQRRNSPERYYLSVKERIREVVRENWTAELGISEDAVVARVFGRLRRQPYGRNSLPAEFAWSPLAKMVASRRRGVKKFGRPRTKTDPD